MSDGLLPRVLLVFGVGFLAANLRLAWDIVKARRLRPTALLVWPGPQPPFYGLMLLLGVVLGILVFVKVVVQHRPPFDAFGEFMMLVYYGYMVPFSLRIGRGFYEHGLWSETGFVPYSEIGSLTWREDERITLVVVPRAKNLARRLVVPQQFYGQARRLLRDRIQAHDILLTRPGLDLLGHDERDDV